MKAEDFVKLLIRRLLTGANGTYFGSMNVLWRKVMSIATTSLPKMAFYQRYILVTNISLYAKFHVLDHSVSNRRGTYLLKDGTSDGMNSFI